MIEDKKGVAVIVEPSVWYTGTPTKNHTRLPRKQKYT